MTGRLLICLSVCCLLTGPAHSQSPRPIFDVSSNSEGKEAQVPDGLLGRWAGAAIKLGTPRLFELEFSLDSDDQLVTMLTLPYNGYDQFPYAFEYAQGGAHDGYLSSGLFGDKMSLVVDLAEGHLRGTVTVGDSMDATVHLQRVLDYDLPGYDVEELRFVAGVDTLAGSLFVPGNRKQPPTALLVAGRGAGTRSGLAIYAKLLARNGIAAFTYDERGTGHSTGDPGSTTGGDRFDDVNSALDLLLERPDLGSVGVIGNSAAGWIVPDVAADRDDVAFVVTLVGPAGSLAEQQAQVTRAFMRASGEEFSDAEYDEAFVYQRRTVELAQSGAPWNEFETVNAAARSSRWAKHALIPESTDDDDLNYFRRRLEFDAPSWERVTVPSLAVFGENDLIVPPRDNVPVLEKALQQNKDATILVLGGADHTLARPEATVGSGSWPDRYYRPWTRDSGFYETLVSWIAERFVP